MPKASQPLRRLLLATLAGLASAPATSPATPSASPEFRLDDRNEPVVVLAFLGTECPLVRLYVDRLNELNERFAKRGVIFVGLCPNVQDSAADIARFALETGVGFPLYPDPEQRTADRFGAIRVPEVVVLDESRAVRYRGRIDDQFAIVAGRDQRRARPEREDLALALEDLLAGKSVAVPATIASGCLIGRARPAAALATPATPEPGITWSSHVSAIFQRRCQACHRPGEIAPFPLVRPEDALGWGDTILEVVSQGRMPPWHADPAFGKFTNDGRLTVEEKNQIERWIAAGMPEGDPAAAPPPARFPTGWQIPPPDQIFHMAETPFLLPAHGAVSYQYFTVDPGFTEGRWIKAVESRPGNPAVVHHINVFLLLPQFAAGYRRDDLTNHLLSAYAPGLRTSPFPEGSAYYVPPGAKLIFQMHYSPIGSEQTDRSYLGVVYADPDEVTERVEIALNVNNRFQIPPGAPDYPVSTLYEYARDATLFALSPHMHLRGKAFRFEAFYPSGEREVLLDIPRFDFNWQTIYELARPKHLPRGTVIQCDARFDNSAANPANPDPTATVRWGDQTFEEMMIGYMFIRVPKESAADASSGLAGASRAAPAAEDALGTAWAASPGKLPSALVALTAVGLLGIVWLGVRRGPRGVTR